MSEAGKRIFFIHSAGSQRGPKDGSNPFLAKLTKSLPDYEIHHPVMPAPDSPNYAAWRKQIAKELTALEGPLILVGHSIGGSILLKYLTEEKVDHQVKALCLVAAPFWGAEDWEIESFILKKNFAASIPKDLKVFLYHGTGDDIVPSAHAEMYLKQIPTAYLRKLKGRGHLFAEGLPELADDLKALD